MDVTFPVFRGSPDGKVISGTTTRTLQANEVYIETTHSGICGTDEHFMHLGQVLGHEGIGIVKQLGSAVTSVRVGDRVGFGYIRKVCGDCDKCRSGWEQFCPKAQLYISHDHDVGSFSHVTVWDASCVFPIPDGYDSADAAPLLCAGASVWSCLTQYNVQPGDRVGVWGLGGLGHLAIKLASCIGCHVVVLSRSAEKREEALEFGASEFHVFGHGNDLERFQPAQHLLVCGNLPRNIDSLVPSMDGNSTIYQLTVQSEPIEMSLVPLILRGICFRSCFIAARHVVQDLLAFAAQHEIKPTIMEFPFTQEGIKDGIQRLREGRIRYRGVLVR